MTGSRKLRFGFALVAIVAAGVLANGASARSSAAEASLSTLNRQVLAAINAFRAAHHLHALRESSQLGRAARQHSFEMGADGYFAHPSANGTPSWRRIERYYPSRNYSYWSVGENLLWSSPQVDAARAMKMWIASPDHRRNLLTPAWRSIGISAVHVLRAPGVYRRRTVTIITTDFGTRH